MYKINTLEGSNYQNLETDTQAYEEIIKMQKVEASENFVMVKKILNMTHN